MVECSVVSSVKEINASLKIEKLNFISTEKAHTAIVESSSFLELRTVKTILVSNEYKNIFICNESRLYFNNISVITFDASGLRESLVTFTSSKDTIHHSSKSTVLEIKKNCSLSVENSVFSSFLHLSGNPFLASSGADRVMVNRYLRSGTSGAAVQYSGSGIFNVTDCDAVNCLGNHCGAFGSWGSAESHLLRCTATNCSANAFGGGTLMNGGTISNIQDNNYTNCATETTNGGGLHHRTGPPSPNDVIIRCYCFNCTNKGGGGNAGGGGMWIGETNGTKIIECCCCQCLATKSIGGGIGLSYPASGEKELNHVIIFDGIAQNEWIPFAAFPNIHINQSAQNIQVEGKTYEFEGNLNTLNMQNTVFESTTQSGGSLFEIHSDKLRVRRIVFKIPHPPFSPTLFRTNTDGDAILDIQNITVMQQSSSLENSVFILLSGIVICESVVIDTLTTQDHSIIKMESSCVSLSANDSVFKNTNCKKGNGSIINSVVGNSSQILLTGCNFSNCSCSGGSGGCCFFRMMLGGQVTLGLHDMEISSCNAEGTENDQGFGGGVFMDIRDGVCDFKFYEMKFQSCTATKGGNSVFVEAKKMRDALIKERIDFNYCGMSDKDLEGFEDGYYGEAIPLIPYLLTFSSPAYVGGTKSRDFTACGFNNYPCSTIEMAVRLRFPSSKRIEGNPLISLEGNDTRYEADRMLLTNVSTTSCNGIIEVSDKASLRIKNSIFTSPLEAVNSCVLFCESSSSIELVNNTLSNISRSDCNGGAICVSIIDRSVLCIDECTFSFCASNRGNGGGICVNLLGDSSLEIGNSSSNKNNGQMINCEASEDNQEAFGLGGGIYLDIKEGSGQFSFDKLLFDSCNARHGSNVFVSAQNLSEKINNMTLKFQLTTLGFHSVEGFENATTGDIFAIPLLVFLWNNFSFPVHVGGSSSGDFSKCGHYEVPCSTIEHAVLLRCGEESRDIELHHPFSLDHELKLDRYPWKISISDEEKRICVMCNEEVRQQGIIETSVKTTMKNLHFQVSSTLENYTSLILCVKSSLSLIDCRILCSERETNVHSSFLIVQSGISSLENFVIDGINFDGASGFIIENEGTFLMNSSSIQEYASTEKGIIEFSFGKEIIIEGCNFSFVETRKGDGSVIKCSVGDEASAIFYSINASSCETDEGNGGVIAAELQEGSTFACGRIDTTTNIQKCASREKNLIGGNGGGIWISINSETCTVKMTSIEFGVGEEGNIATNNGENIFLLGEDLTKLSIDQWIKLNISTNPEDHSKYIGKDRSRMQIVPIVSFMHEWCKPAFVGGTEEFYYPTCGFYFYPCSSIQYAVSTKFGNERADLTLLKQFKFKDCTNFDSKPVYINGENEGLEIEVMGTIEGTGNGLLEINIPVTVSEIGFSLPSRFNKPSINTIFLCETSTLVLENSFVSAKDENVMYCFIKVMGGILTIRKFEIGPIVFKSSSVIVFEGAESNGNMTEMDFKEVQIIEGNSLIWMRNGIVNLTNCTMQKTIQQDNNGVRIEEGCSVEMENSTFSQMKRDRGNGGVVNCVVGNGKTVRIENCTFSNGSTGSGERGGGLFLNIKESSSFLFNRNDINWCFTPSESGYGGGIYVRFDVMLKNYSMKNLSFRENVAWRGKDIFVVCAAPRIVINPLLWNGTSSETEDEDARRRLWVVDDEPALLIDRSLFYYLYPTTDEILFVDKSGSAEMNCGFEDTPCINVELGLKKMNEEKLTIQIQKEAELNGIINRNGSSLTIRGNQTKVRMEIGQNGHLELTNGTLNTGLTLSKLQVGVPENSKESELLAVCIGLASITNCEFLILARSYSSTNVQIASVKGGELHMTDTLIQGISFTAKKGVFFVENANMQIELTSFRNITSESDSLIAGYVESIITLKMVDLDECKLLKGSICSVGKGNIEITNSSSFSGFEKTSRDGGMLRFLLELFDEFGSQIINMVGMDKANYSESPVDLYMLLVKRVSDCVFDLNTSVTSNSFAFDWNSFKGENNLFVGSDKVHEEVDLFLFLDKFQNECIRISSGGYDVMRCGDDNFPCRSFWKGYYQLIESTNQKKIVIEGETKVENSFDLRNITIESSDAFSKTEKIGKLSFGFLQEGIESYLLNYGSLNFVLIKFEISQEVDSVASSLITNKNGELVVESCSLGCFIEFYTIFYCSFCCIYGGYANICDFTAESMNVGKGLIIVDSSSLGCLIDSTRLLSLNVSSSSLIEVRNSDEIDGIHKFNNIGTVKLGIGNCLISNVIEKDNEACVLGTNTPYGVELKMNGSVIEDAKAINSQEGGGVYFRLNSGGLFRMENSTITRSCCSDTGYGGGVYLESQLTDKLNFLFFKMIFSGNTGGFGRDVFVSCVNIANQVNESHFMFDLREDHFIRQNAIFGKDVTKYINVVDLLDFITIFQADTIIVSSFETNNGSDTRQCGSHSLPCLSIDYGINHLTNDYLSRMIVDTKSLINGEMSLEEMTLSSKTKNQAEVQIVPITFTEKMKDTIIKNSEKGGVSIEEGDVWISKCEFINNGAGAEKYPSARKNIACSENGVLLIESLKGGDGAKENSSLWIANSGCSLQGIVDERISALFIPIVESVEIKADAWAGDKGEEREAIIRGQVLMPCNLWMRVEKWNGADDAAIWHEVIEESGYVSEREVQGRVRWQDLGGGDDLAEVRIGIEFGEIEESGARQHTECFVVKNRSEQKSFGDEKITEGAQSPNASWSVISDGESKREEQKSWK
eukprot:MONOS_12138.1-p1 / transcript=MONOS_12138.1 / gene=MONOS_12138 / organism=Monocercomonoides_exilis_PA203 / gene_product=unspecified product / transcript_product=unspecified product / location=Mono_scaffold00651:2410-13165(-) / protein_length=2721 / sequence_SO=supercontig / SO=protein_coding / is_pseudo=false